MIDLKIQNSAQLPPAITCCEFSAAAVCFVKVHLQKKWFRKKLFWRLRMSKVFQEMFRKKAFSKGDHIFRNMRTLSFILWRFYSMLGNFLMEWESLENVENEWKREFLFQNNNFSIQKSSIMFTIFKLRLSGLSNLQKFSNKIAFQEFLSNLDNERRGIDVCQDTLPVRTEKPRSGSASANPKNVNANRSRAIRML